MNQGIDSKALVTTLIMKIPILLAIAVAGAIIGSGLNLVIAVIKSGDEKYVSETEYYIEFADGRYEARDYYNAFTWNDVMGTDLILGKMMTLLGDDYDRDTVKDMLEANIYSDVRYLKITVKSENYDEVVKVEETISPVLSEFGETMDEFTSIYKINDEGISKEETTYFTLRAALLGAFIFWFAALIVIMFKFCLGSSFYTKRDVTKTLDIPVFGISFKNGSYEGVKDMPMQKYNDMFYQDENDRDKLIAVIPFGKPYREKIMDEIYDMELKGMKVSGAVITDADSRWYKIYRR
jgi:capsular polysaccharide biosynthesis protein